MSTATDATKDFKDKLMRQATGALNLNLLLIGEELGLFKVLLNVSSPIRSDVLARAAGINERYCKEWCVHMAAMDVLTIADPVAITFALKDGIAPAIKDTSTLGIVKLCTALTQNPEQLINAYKTGCGIAWGDHHDFIHAGVRRFITPLYEGPLVPSLPPSVVEVLQNGGSLLDLGCGQGVACCVLGTAFPKATILGCDYHGPSIVEAKRLVEESGLENVSFHLGTAADTRPIGAGNYDVVTFFDSFHDMSDATAAAKAAFSHLKASGGQVLLIEPAASDHDNLQEQLALPTTPIYSAFSCHVCLPCSMQNNGDGLGTLTPTSKHREIFLAAGFNSFEKLKTGIDDLGFRMMLATKAGTRKRAFRGK